MKEHYETLSVERIDEHLATVTLNRPRAANAMNTQMGHDLHDLFTAIMLQPGDLRAIIVTGAGETVFCAGGDLKERDGMTDETWRAQHVLFEQAFYTLIDCPVPVIAAVNGAAFGGGAEMALCCDFIYATDNARFALTEITLGIIPGGGGTQNLPRAVGTRRAKELILTGRPFSAAKACEWGMVNAVYPQAELMPAVLETARCICGNGPLSVRRAKRAINLGIGVDLSTGLGIEIEAYNQLVGTEDRLEGVRAYNEKRKPDFKGR